MRQGKVFYKDYLAGIITETNEGEYVFQYNEKYVNDHPDDFISFFNRVE
jgi:serine/threonine-protein kinase HipA